MRWLKHSLSRATKPGDQTREDTCYSLIDLRTVACSGLSSGVQPHVYNYELLSLPSARHYVVSVQGTGHASMILASKQKTWRFFFPYFLFRRIVSAEHSKACCTLIEVMAGIRDHCQASESLLIGEYLWASLYHTFWCNAFKYGIHS